MRNLLFSLLSILLLPVLGKAQFGYGKVSEIEAVQERKLIVIVQEPSDKVIKKLQKKNQNDKLGMYNAALDSFNNNMKNVVAKFWTFSKTKPLYLTYKQADSIRKTGDDSYAVLYCASASMSTFSSGFEEEDGLDWTWDITDDSKDRDYFDGFTEMKVSTLEDLKKKPVFYVVLTDIFPTATSLVNGIYTLQTYMDIRLRSKRDNEDISSKEWLNQMVEKNNSKLKTKTLLIREDFLDKGFDKYKIADAYPYKFEIVTAAKLDSVVMAKDSRYVYAMIVPAINSGTRNNQVFYMQQAIGADNGEIYAYNMPTVGGAMFGAEFGTRKIGRKSIDSKVLTSFVNPK